MRSAQAGVAHCAIVPRNARRVPTDTAIDVDNRVEFTNSLCVVNADQFPFLADDFPELFAATRRMIGYWFWELEHVPVHMRRVDRARRRDLGGVAVRRRRVRRGFAGARSPRADPDRRAGASHRDRGQLRRRSPTPATGRLPHRVRPLQRDRAQEPARGHRGVPARVRARRGPGADHQDDERASAWASHQRVLAAADGRDDIVVWDETLTRADQMALVAAADCMVSLHRSEGLGLHLAEAMWLGTPTIATRYSGNLDFMDDDNSLLVDCDAGQRRTR